MAVFHDFEAQTLAGQTQSMRDFAGKKLLVVNTASECGLTPQYEQLQELQQEFGGERFTVIGFPSNDFGAQEPGTASQIAEFCSANYGVTFPMMAKVVVKGAADQHPIYRWLTQQSENGKQDAEVTWNFQKFLVDEQGRWQAVLPPTESPISEQVINWLEQV